MLGARNRKLNKTVSALNELKKSQEHAAQEIAQAQLNTWWLLWVRLQPDLSQAGPCVILLYVVSVFRKSGAEEAPVNVCWMSK